MTYQTLTPPPDRWDDFVEQHPRAHLLQLSAWGALKQAFGWEPVRVALADDRGDLVAGCQVLLRALPLKLGRFAYIPYGPLVDWTDAAQVRALAGAIDQVARQHGAAFVKIEPGLYLHDVDFAAAGFRPSPQTIQPPRTIVLDIDADDETIQKRMNQKTRRNIRKSNKLDVAISMGTHADLPAFTTLIAETGARGGFGVHTADYYVRAFDLFAPQERVGLILGHYGDQLLAAVMVFRLGDWAWYFYGASSTAERKRMASYGVQWAGIEWARAQGARYYNMYGVPDAPAEQLEAQFQSRSDGLWGVYRFKRGWGGEVVRGVGAWDRVYNRVVYAAYRLALRVRGDHE